MPPPNKQWAFIQSLMEWIEGKEEEIDTLWGKYERAKALMSAQGSSLVLFQVECHYQELSVVAIGLGRG